MLRWLILLVCFATWAGVMTLVYREYGPKPVSAEVVANRESLDAVFAENAPKLSKWKIYMDLDKLAGPAGHATGYTAPNLGEQLKARQDQAKAAAESAGAEPGEQLVGNLEIRLLRRGETRAAQYTTLDIHLPAGLSPSILQALGDLRFESAAHLAMDKGLEDFVMTLKAGLGVTVTAKGFREGEDLKATLLLQNGEQDLALNHFRFPMTGASSPLVTLSPFYSRPNIREGDRWQVAMLEISGSLNDLRLAGVEARVVGKRSIRYHGKDVHVFEVEAKGDRGRLTAFYSADGRVLKESWKIFEILNLTLLREEIEAEDRAPFRSPALDP